MITHLSHYTSCDINALYILMFIVEQQEEEGRQQERRKHKKKKNKGKKEASLESMVTGLFIKHILQTVHGYKYIFRYYSSEFISRWGR